MFDKFKEEKGGEMMEERIEGNVSEEESVEASPNSESTLVSLCRVMVKGINLPS